MADMRRANADERADWEPALPDRARSTSAQIVLAVAVGFGFLWVGKVVLLTLIVSGMLAFILDPLVELSLRARLSQPLGAFLVVALALAVVIGLGMLLYARVADFARDVPRYWGHIRQSLERLDKQRQKLQETTAAVLPESAREDGKKTVRLEQDGGWSSELMAGLGSAVEVLIAASFVPFLVYFMLSWARHLSLATVGLFPAPQRSHVNGVLGEIAAVIRTFISGNFFIGVVLSVLSILVFALLRLPNFYIVGPLSGFLSVVPYLGVVLAVAPPWSSASRTCRSPARSPSWRRCSACTFWP
jgi:predicted PurR-regulated permease PerM